MSGKLWWMIVPALVVLLGLLGYGLTSNPKHIPSPLIGKPFPTLEGEDLNGNKVVLGVEKDKPTIVNVWASWCVACRAEHQVLLRGAQRYGDSVSLVAINYKDERTNAKAWLRQLGNPYLWSFYDKSGRAGLELGVYGVPETFFVNRDGIIVEKISAPLTDEQFAAGVALISK